jgi:phosphoribosylglycinamide formyltransferase-1
MPKIVLFASGSGSNVENIIRYFQESPSIEVAFVFTNKQEAGVLERCKRLGVPAAYLNKAALDSPAFLEMLKNLNPNLIVLAGYLQKIKADWVTAFSGRIINIHPALLPNYGGKGMYGMNVHEAVIQAKEKESGISIHYVNEHYDQGALIAQYTVSIDAQDTAEQLAQKVQALEHRYFPAEIEKLLQHAD